MSEMLDRVAKAIAETIALAHIKHNLREIGQEDKLEEYLKTFPIKVTLADSDVARAAIEAMREPTVEMVEAVDIDGETDAGGGINATYSIGSEEAKKVWQAMIDAALEWK
jgi:hypothetical protein